MLFRQNIKLILFFFVVRTTIVVAQNNFLIEKLGNHINTAADEITPIIDWDGNVMYFTRVGAADFNRNLILDNKDQSTILSEPQYFTLLKDIYSKIAESDIANPISSGYNQDIWIANSTNKEFDKIVHPPAPMNNALPNSISALMPALRTFIVINQFIPEGGMDVGFSVVKQLDDSTWTFPEPLEIENFYTRQAGTSLSISSDGKVMVLALSRNDTHGDLDLYVAFKQDNNTWSAPKNMGKTLNTRFRESTPYISLDTKRLYFASNRPTSLGGMDLYFVDRLDDSWTNWSSEKHFINPINSTFDDSQPFFNPATGYFYFTSKREGSSDIYRVQTAPPSPNTYTITGKIINGSKDTITEADIIFGVKGSDDLKVTYSRNGEYSITAPKGETLKIYAQKDGFVSASKEVKVEKYEHFPNGYNLDIRLIPLEEGGKITLKNLYFKQSEPEILPSSFDELEELTRILQENPSMTIQVEGHTDNTGNTNDLILLSEKRAEAVRDFLIQKNINPNRISAKGFGGSSPIFINPKDEKERQANRRVEVRIIKK